MPLRVAVNYGRDAALEPEALNEDRPMGGIRAQVPPALAERGRRGAWAAYGYHAASTPRLVRSSVAVTMGAEPAVAQLRAPGTCAPECERHQAKATSAPEATETSND
jgi:hypothetical protein